MNLIFGKFADIISIIGITPSSGVAISGYLTYSRVEI